MWEASPTPIVASKIVRDRRQRRLPPTFLYMNKCIVLGAKINSSGVDLRQQLAAAR